MTTKIATKVRPVLAVSMAAMVGGGLLLSGCSSSSGAPSVGDSTGSSNPTPAISLAHHNGIDGAWIAIDDPDGGDGDNFTSPGDVIGIKGKTLTYSTTSFLTGKQRCAITQKAVGNADTNKMTGHGHPGYKVNGQGNISGDKKRVAWLNGGRDSSMKVESGTITLENLFTPSPDKSIYITLVRPDSDKGKAEIERLCSN